MNATMERALAESLKKEIVRLEAEVIANDEALERMKDLAATTRRRLVDVRYASLVLQRGDQTAEEAA